MEWYIFKSTVLRTDTCVLCMWRPFGVIFNCSPTYFGGVVLTEPGALWLVRWDGSHWAPGIYLPFSALPTLRLQLYRSSPWAMPRMQLWPTCPLSEHLFLLSICTLLVSEVSHCSESICPVTFRAEYTFKEYPSKWLLIINAHHWSTFGFEKMEDLCVLGSYDGSVGEGSVWGLCYYLVFIVDVLFI